MLYLQPLFLIMQGIGLLLIIGALFVPSGSTEAREVVLGPIRVAVRRPKMCIVGLLLLGLGLLFEASGNLLSKVNGT